MKLIIAGGRNLFRGISEIQEDLNNYELYENLNEVISGGATGIDNCGEEFAKERYIGIKEFPADWDKHGKAAGPIRNRQMAEYGDALLLIWDGKSRGSANMKKEMEKLGKPVYEVILKQPEIESPQKIMKKVDKILREL